MRKIVLVIALFFSSVSFASASQSYIVAKINDNAITRQELLDRFKFVVKVSKISIRSQKDRDIILNQSLEKMIEEELIRQEASKLKVSVSDAEIRETIDLIALQQKKNATQLKIYFIKNGLSFDSYLKQIEAEILWSKIVSGAIRPRIKVTEVEVRELFEQKKLSTDKKKFFISEIFIPKSKNSKLLAQKLVLELKGGADFRNLVKQFSASITSENDGEIGWVSQSDIDQQVFKAISNLKKNEYSSAIELSDGFHIFKILNMKIDDIIPTQDMKVAKDIIFERKLQSAARGYLMNLKRNSFVEVSL